MKKFFPLILVAFVFIIVVIPIFTKQSTARKNLVPSQVSYWVVEIESEKYLTHTSFPLSVGDEYISANNKFYKIVKIVKDKAYVREIK